VLPLPLETLETDHAAALPSLVAGARAAAAVGALAALEALWGNDGEGLHVAIVAIVERPGWQHSRFSAIALARIPAGRTHTGPSWPEAALAWKLGERAAAVLGVPFHFASRLRPSDEGVRWWNRGTGHACDDCGAELDQNPAVHWFGMCYGCHTVREDKQRRLHVVVTHDVDVRTYDHIRAVIDAALHASNAGHFYAGSRVRGQQALWFLCVDPRHAGDVARAALLAAALLQHVELRAASSAGGAGDVLS
jgi:hypothetical protein